MSKSGIVLVGLYAVISVACLVCGLGALNAKDSSTLVQLPVLPTLLLAEVLSATEWLTNAPWFASLVVFWPITAAVLYVIGHVFGLLSPKAKLMIGAFWLVVVLASFI